MTRVVVVIVSYSDRLPLNPSRHPTPLSFCLQVIVLSDGLANVGLGAVDTEEAKSVAGGTYDKIAEWTVSNRTIGTTLVTGWVVIWVGIWVWIWVVGGAGGGAYLSRLFTFLSSLPVLLSSLDSVAVWHSRRGRRGRAGA